MRVEPQAQQGVRLDDGGEPAGVGALAGELREVVGGQGRGGRGRAPWPGTTSPRRADGWRRRGGSRARATGGRIDRRRRQRVRRAAPAAWIPGRERRSRCRLLPCDCPPQATLNAACAPGQLALNALNASDGTESPEMRNQKGGFASVLELAA